MAVSDLAAVLQDYGPVLLGAVLRLGIAYLNSRATKLDPTSNDMEGGK